MTKTAKPDVAVVSIVRSVVELETSRSLEEMIFDTATKALNAAGLTAATVDSVVLSGQDQIDGRVISIMPSTGPAGGVNRDTTLIASSGDHALIYGYLRLLAGQGRNVLVMGWAKPSESVDPDRAELMAAEPYLLRATGMNNTVAAALQASKWVEAGHFQPEGPYVAWPLRRDQLPARGDSVFAAVLAVDGAFKAGSELAWIVDAGWATVSYELGARDLGELSALDAALAQILKRQPDLDPSTWDLVEVGAPSEPAVAMATRALGVGPNASVNSSGPLAASPTSPHVLGLGRILAAAEAVHSDGPRKIAAGVGFHGFAGQGATVVVFSNRIGGAA